MHLKREFEEIRKHPETAQSFLEALIKHSNNSLRLLGKQGETLLRAFQTAGTVEGLSKHSLGFMDTGDSINGAFYPFHPKNGPLNKIEYDLSLFVDYADFFERLIHERTHAIQYDTIPCLHAVSGNPYSSISLGAKNYIQRELIIEKVAYSVQTLLYTKFAQKEPSSFSNPNELNNTRLLFDALHKENKDNQNRAFNLLGDSWNHYIAENYLMKAWNDFGRCVSQRFAFKELPNIHFCKLDEDSIRDLNNSALHLSLDEAETQLPEFSWSQRLFFSIESFLTCGRQEKNLPTFKEILETKNIRPDQFLAESKVWTPPEQILT